MTVDSSSTVTMGIGAASPAGTLYTATPTRTLASGVATWSDIKITSGSPTGSYKLEGDSSVSGVSNALSLPINITP